MIKQWNPDQNGHFPDMRIAMVLHDDYGLYVEKNCSLIRRFKRLEKHKKGLISDKLKGVKKAEILMCKCAY